MGTVPKPRPLPGSRLPLFPPLSQHFRRKSRHGRSTLRRKIFAGHGPDAGNRGSSEHYSQEPLGIQQITSVRYRTDWMENDSEFAVSLTTPTTGHSGLEKRRKAQCLAPWFARLYLAKGQKPTILVLGSEAGEKRHSRADSIRFNFSQEGSGIAAAGSGIGGPGIYACHVQPWLGGLLLRLKPFLKHPTDQVHHL